MPKISKAVLNIFPFTPCSAMWLHWLPMETQHTNNVAGVKIFSDCLFAVAQPQSVTFISTEWRPFCAFVNHNLPDVILAT